MTTKDQTDVLTSAVLAALTPAVAEVFRDQASRFLAPRVADTIQALTAADPELGLWLPTPAAGHKIRRAIAPAVTDLVRRDPGRSYVADAAGELLGVTHPQLLDALTAAIRAAPRKRERKVRA